MFHEDKVPVQVNITSTVRIKIYKKGVPTYKPAVNKCSKSRALQPHEKNFCSQVVLKIYKLFTLINHTLQMYKILVCVTSTL